MRKTAQFILTILQKSQKDNKGIIISYKLKFAQLKYVHFTLEKVKGRCIRLHSAAQGGWLLGKSRSVIGGRFWNVLNTILKNNNFTRLEVSDRGIKAT